MITVIINENAGRVTARINNNTELDFNTPGPFTFDTLRNALNALGVRDYEDHCVIKDGVLIKIGHDVLSRAISIATEENSFDRKSLKRILATLTGAQTIGDELADRIIEGLVQERVVSMQTEGVWVVEDSSRIDRVIL